MRYLVPMLSIAAVLAGCATPRPAPIVRPVPVVTPSVRPVPSPSPLTGDWNDWPFSMVGEWRYEAGSASIAASGPLLTMKCDRKMRSIVITGIEPGRATIRTTTMTRTMTVGATLSLSANDPLLDAIAFSRGRFVIEQTGFPPLVLRPHAEIGRVIEDCRG